MQIFVKSCRGSSEFIFVVLNFVTPEARYTNSLLKHLTAARAPLMLPYVATLAFSLAVNVRYVPRFFGRASASAFFTSLLTSVSMEGGTDCASEGSMPAYSMGRG